jgi:nitrate/nitrite transporter NarK
MAERRQALQARTGITRGIAWLILLTWGAWWALFGLAAGIGNFGDLGWGGLVDRLIMPVLIVLTLILCWRREFFGSVLLVIVVVFSYYFCGLNEAQDHPVVRQMLLLTMTLPPLLGAMLLMLCGVATWRMRKMEPD